MNKKAPTAPRVVPTKNDVDLFRIQSDTEKFVALVNLGKTIVAGATICGCVYLTFAGLAPLMMREKGSIEAFSRLLKGLHGDRIILGLWGTGATAAWWLERRGKKRALAKKSELQKKLEGDDAHRSSSHNPL